MSKRILFFFLIFSMPLCFLFPCGLFAQEKNVVGFGGLWTAGPETNYPIYSRIKKKHPGKMAGAVTNAVEKIAEDLPFKILIASDAEEMKKYIDYPYSLAVAITRDDVVCERFSTPIAEINKTIVNAGMVVMLYQTAPDPNNPLEQRNTILFSLPLVGYHQQLDGDKRLTEDEVDDLFIKTVAKTFETHLIKRLKGIRLDKIQGKVVAMHDNGVVVNFGTLQGMETDNKVDFFDATGKKIGRGTVTKIQKGECEVKPDGKFSLPEGCNATGHICKGMSEDSYQVASFKISSKKAAALFDEKILGQQVAQWFSDFLVERAGKAVLPSKLNGEWVTEATGESFSVFVKDGQAHRFQIPSPRYPIHLNLTGLNCKIIEGNNVNEIWGYKAWLQVDIPDKTFSKKFDELSTKNLVPGIQQHMEKDEFFDLIHQLTAKAAMEESL